jgi:hypothetical protein
MLTLGIGIGKKKFVPAPLPTHRPAAANCRKNDIDH